MDNQQTKKRAVKLGAMSALLGGGAVIAHRTAKHPGFNANTVKFAKMFRNVVGAGAVGAGVGSAILAVKYHKNKKKEVQ